MKTILWPSGDQDAKPLKAWPSVKRVCPLPSAFIKCIVCQAYLPAAIGIRYIDLQIAPFTITASRESNPAAIVGPGGVDMIVRATYQPCLKTSIGIHHVHIAWYIRRR